MTYFNIGKHIVNSWRKIIVKLIENALSFVEEANLACGIGVEKLAPIAQCTNNQSLRVLTAHVNLLCLSVNFTLRPFQCPLRICPLLHPHRRNILLKTLTYEEFLR